MSDTKPSPRQLLESITITRRRTPYQIIHNRAALALAVAAIAIIYFIVILITFHPSGITGRRDNLSLLIRGSWGVVGFAAAIGVASAGVIQIVKQLAGVRGYFQRIWVMEWIGDRVSNKSLWNRWVIDNRDNITETPDTPTTVTVNENLAKQIADVQRERGASELEEALLGGLSPREFRRVFDLPTEQLCAQIRTSDSECPQAGCWQTASWPAQTLEYRRYRGGCLTLISHGSSARWSSSQRVR
jgi:hypothetical protein